MNSRLYVSISNSYSDSFVPLYKSRGMSIPLHTETAGGAMPLSEVLLPITKLQNWMGADYQPVVAPSRDVVSVLMECPLLEPIPGSRALVSPLAPFHITLGLEGCGVDIEWMDIDPFTGVAKLDDVDPTGYSLIVTHDPPGAINPYRELMQFGIPVLQDASLALASTYDYQSLVFTGGDFVVFDLPTSIAPVESRLSFIFTEYHKDITQPILKHSYNLLEWHNVLDHVSEDAEHSRRIAKSYCRLLQGYRTGSRWVHVQPYEPNMSYPFFVLICSHPDSLIMHLLKKGIAAYPYYRHTEVRMNGNISYRALPGFEFFLNHHVCIPCGWWIDEETVMNIVEAIKEWVGG